MQTTGFSCARLRRCRTLSPAATAAQQPRLGLESSPRAMQLNKSMYEHRFNQIFDLYAILSHAYVICSSPPFISRRRVQTTRQTPDTATGGNDVDTRPRLKSEIKQVISLICFSVVAVQSRIGFPWEGSKCALYYLIIDGTRARPGAGSRGGRGGRFQGIWGLTEVVRRLLSPPPPPLLLLAGS